MHILFEACNVPLGTYYVRSRHTMFMSGLAKKTNEVQDAGLIVQKANFFISR